MASRLLNLNGGDHLPQEFLVDTNMLVTQFIPNSLIPSDPGRQARVAEVFSLVMEGTVEAYASSRSVDELFHVYLRAWYTHELKANKAKYEGALRNQFGQKRLKEQAGKNSTKSGRAWSVMSARILVKLTTP